METKNPAKLRILATVNTYLPGYKAGGPLRTVSNIVDSLGDEFTFRIVTGDRDSGDLRPYPDIVTDRWLKVGKAEVCYVSPHNRSLWSIARLLNTTPHDVLYLNSFFCPVFSILPIVALRFGLALRRPMIIAPRGEFSEGAIGIKMRKKLAYLSFYRSFLHKAPLLFQASSQIEATQIAARIRRPHETFVAPDLVSLPNSVPEFQLQEGPIRICFVSRISPKKNLLFALRALQQVVSPVSFDIFGPKEDRDYWERCESLVQNLPPNIHARYCGRIEHRDIPTVLSRHDLFIFPTLGENFGHVIVESLLAGTPVFLADTTPWTDLDHHGAGRVLPLGDASLWARAIDEFAASNPDKRLAARIAARRRGEAFCRDQSVTAANRDLFLRAGRMCSR
jgi:glycosyltransferase involved in cell wall biosynthesis